MAGRSSEQSAEDVAPALVAGQDAVADHERNGAHVIRDDAQRDVRLFRAVVVRDAGQAADFLQDLVHGVDIIDRVYALHDAGHSLKAHAGIDIGVSQWHVGTVFLSVELGENEVPEFHVAVAVAAGLAVGLAAAVLGTSVEIHFAAGTAGTRADLPEVVVLAEAHDAFLGHADLVSPDRVSFVVIFVDSRPDFVLGDIQPFRGRDEFPAPVDGSFLEIVAEGEIAQHFEERCVSGSVAHVVDVVRADALLRRGHPLAGRRLGAAEIGLQRSHACRDQQKGFIVFRDKRIACVSQVILGLPELQKLFAQLVYAHVFHKKVPPNITIYNT